MSASPDYPPEDDFEMVPYERPEQQNPYGRKRDEQAGPEELLKHINRALPWSADAESGTLSSLLQEPERLTEARRLLPLGAFYHESNRTVYEALLAMDAKIPKLVIDSVTLGHWMESAGTLERIGGRSRLIELFTFIPSPSHFLNYVKILRDQFIVRAVIQAGAEVVKMAQDYSSADSAGVDAVIDLVTRAEAKTFAVLEQARTSSENRNQAKPASVGVAEWLEYNDRVEKSRGKIIGIATGILELDSVFHGIDDSEGELLVISGRPGSGKTAMACSIADHLAVQMGIPGLVFSIEMSGNQFYIRMILGMAEVETSKAMTGHYSDVDKAAMGVQVAKTSRAPLYVCDNGALNEMEILAQLQYFKRVHNIRWFMVDHLHKVRHTNPKIQADERMRLTSVMETLRYAKKELKLAGFVLVQLSRETDRNKNNPPTLADLSGSGAIEQDTEGVVTLVRPCMVTSWQRMSADAQQAWREMVEPRRQRNPTKWSRGSKYSEKDGGWAREDYEEDAIAHVLKNRRGPTPEVHIRYQGEFTRFSSRMPVLNSGDWRDWQIGTYRSTSATKPVKENKIGSYAKKGGVEAHERLTADEFFGTTEEEQP